MNKKEEVKLKGVVKIKENIVVSLRCYFSIQHIRSAVYFADEANKIEKQTTKIITDDLITIHRAYVTGSIFATVAFLEANINEILRDSYDAMNGQSKDESKYIPVQLINKIGQFYKQPKKKKSRVSSLEKYQIALKFAKKEIFNEKENLYQNVDSFRRLRNSLVHYEPKWLKTQSPDDYIPIGDIEKRLYSKFELNPLTGKGNPFFPDKCLGYGCCKWGIKSSIAFTDEFCERTEIRSKYTQIRSKLKLD